MKNLETLLKKHKYIVFMDFEGTQFSHEMIALGAVICVLDKKKQIKRRKKSFLVYVKPKNKIGKYVSELTGITETLLKKKAVSFKDAMKQFKKYCGSIFTKASFVTFGNHDLKILNQSIVYNLDAPKEICSQIQKNYLDFQAVIAEYIRDDKCNPLSLSHYLEVFALKEEGRAHNAEYDAINLASLYDAFLKNKDTVLEKYILYMQKMNSIPEPVRNILKRIAKGDFVNINDLKDEAKKFLI